MANRLKLIKRGLLILLIGICVLLIVSSLNFYEEKYTLNYGVQQIEKWQVYINAIEIKEEITLPHRIEENKKDNAITIISEIPKININEPYLLVRVSQQTMKVEIDNKLVYEFKSMMETRNKSSGAIWRLIELPKDCAEKQISLTFNSSYDETAGIINQVYLGEKSEHILMLVKKSMSSLMVGFTLLVLSMFVIVLYLAIKYKYKEKMKEYFYLAIFLFMLAVIVLIESQGMTFLLNNFALYYYCEFIALYSIPIYFYGYVYYSYDLNKKKLVKKLMNFHIIVFTLSLIGEVSGRYDFFQVQFKFLIVFIITLASCIIITTKELPTKKSLIRFILASVMVLAILIVDLLLFYFRRGNIGSSILRIAIVTVEIALSINIFTKVFNYFQSNTENIYLQKQIKTNLYYYENIKSKSNLLRKFRHDMKNHFVTINYLLADERIEEAKEYISKLNEHIVESSEIIDSGNYILDAILTEKKIRAAKKNIKFSIKMSIQPNIKIDAVDWCIIFGNILDNALEACSKLEEPERIIDINLKTQGNMFIIMISNSFDGKVIKGKHGYETRKLNKEYHGFGLKNIKESIKKYEGNYKVDIKENVFKVSIVLTWEEDK